MDSFEMNIAKYKIESLGEHTDLISLDILVYSESPNPSAAMDVLKFIDRQCSPKIFPEQKV